MIEIKDVEPTRALVSALRQVPIKGDTSVRPYLNATIAVETVQIQKLIPLAKYVLQDQLDLVRSLQEGLKRARLDILDLKGRVIYAEGQEERVISPPIVEVWEEEGDLLVDGLHRTWLAREEGREEMTAVVIRNVKVPLVPLPTTWESVRLLPRGHDLNADEKRDYRFESPVALQSVVGPSASKVTPDNFRYFLYRMLDYIGSTGIRRTADETSNKGDDRG